MEEKIYVVTLHRRDNLEGFYDEMQRKNFRLALKRPLSRNTHYWMTEEQAQTLRYDERVWGVELLEDLQVKYQISNNEPYVKNGTFWKDDTIAPANVSSFDFQWGHIHCAGDPAQRGKNSYGPISSGWSYENVLDTVQVFNNGRDVDVVIVDDPIAYDSEEWYSPTTNQTRFVQYQWFDELNTVVGFIDDDGQTLPTGIITYHDNASIPYYHGQHVAGIAVGQHYGWAREANIFNIAVTGTWPSGQSVGAFLIYDYLRAFHLTKPINPGTGKRNPTITNHSYGGIRYMPDKGGGVNRLDFSDLTSLYYRGVTYNSTSPGPSGWTEAGVEADFGVRFGLETYPSYSSAIAADVQDAIEDGVVIIGAAGNNNLLIAAEGDQDWDNYLTVNGVGSFYYNRGAWPNTPDSGAINVGALSKQADFRRSTYTEFGPGVDVFAPGDNILSAYDSTGLIDNKYGANNYFYPTNGTSMASPQVAGAAAILASGKERFTNEDVRGYLQRTSINDDMTFDLLGGGLDDNSCGRGSPNKYLHVENPRKSIGYLSEVKGQRTSGMVFPRTHLYYREDTSAKVFDINVIAIGTSAYSLSGSDRNGAFLNSSNKSLNIKQRDILIFTVNVTGHPFWIKTVPQTGTGFVVDVNTTTNNGASTGTIIWDTATITPGTYYYICQFHSGMIGSITIT